MNLRGGSTSMPAIPGDASNEHRIKLALRERSAYRFLQLSGKVMRCLAEMYTKRYGLSIGTWKALSMIGACGSLSSSELGRFTSLEADKVTRAVDALVRKKFVSRRRDRKDRRRAILELTAKGRAVNAAIETVRQSIEIDLMSSLDADQIEALYHILDALEVRADEIFLHKEAWRDCVARHGTAVDGNAGEATRSIAQSPEASRMSKIEDRPCRSASKARRSAGAI